MLLLLKALIAVLSLLFGAHYAGLWAGELPHPDRRGGPTPDELACRPFLPRLFTRAPPLAGDPALAAASARLRAHLDARFAALPIDGMSVAVVGRGGVLLEEHWGAQRANESADAGGARIGRHSMYRLASVSKLLLVFEGQLLVQRGVIQWDDPVSKYLPDFRPNFTSFAAAPNPRPPPVVTLRDLASHLSGLGRDWPPGTLASFPNSTDGSAPPPDNGLPFPSAAGVLSAIAQHRLVLPPGVWPSYSNTGAGVLGLALVAANRMHAERTGAQGGGVPATVASLMERDVFGPLRMNGSAYLATPANAHRIVVPSFEPEVVDQDFKDAMNPSGGQFASLADLTAFASGILDPESGLLTENTLAKWLRPAHAFEEDDWTESGLIWEIIKHIDAHGRRRRIYWKLGNLDNFHSAFALHPGSGYAVIVLLSGAYPDAGALAYDAFDVFQPAVDAALAAAVGARYAGRWRSADGRSEAALRVVRGTLWLDRYVLQGADVLRVFGVPNAPPGRGAPIPLREVREDEFRIDAAMPGWIAKRHMGCFAQWGNLDWGMKNDAGVNVVYFAVGADGAWELHAPAVGVSMRRVT